MKIEAGLSDADDARLRRERREFVRSRLGVIGRFVRMHTDRAPDIGMRFGNRAHRRKLVEPRANRHHRADPGGTGALDDSLALWREVGEIEMAMAVDQQLRRSPLPPRHSAEKCRAAPATRAREATR